MNIPSEFEWDDAKAESNMAKHGVPFEAAVEVFDDDARIERQDSRRDYGEDRFNVVGAVDGYVINVTYTMRGDVGRIISAPLATKKERTYYGDRS